MKSDNLRESLELTDNEWQALEVLADLTKSTSRRGRSAGQPSWRILIKRIASGEIKLQTESTLEQ